MENRNNKNKSFSFFTMCLIRNHTISCCQGCDRFALISSFQFSWRTCSAEWWMGRPNSISSYPRVRLFFFSICFPRNVSIHLDSTGSNTRSTIDYRSLPFVKNSRVLFFFQSRRETSRMWTTDVFVPDKIAETTVHHMNSWEKEKRRKELSESIISAGR